MPMDDARMEDDGYDYDAAYLDGLAFDLEQDLHREWSRFIIAGELRRIAATMRASRDVDTREEAEK